MGRLVVMLVLAAAAAVPVRALSQACSSCSGCTSNCCESLLDVCPVIERLGRWTGTGRIVMIPDDNFLHAHLHGEIVDAGLGTARFFPRQPNLMPSSSAAPTIDEFYSTFITSRTCFPNVVPPPPQCPIMITPPITSTDLEIDVQWAPSVPINGAFDFEIFRYSIEQDPSLPGLTSVPTPLRVAVITATIQFTHGVEILTIEIYRELPDTDADGVPDASDNCPNTPNPNQNDCDNDGLGDACEASSDCNANGIPDECELPIACEPDAFPAATNLTFVYPGVELRRVPFGSVIRAATLNLASTGTRVFSDHINTEWLSSTRTLLAVFDPPARSVSIDVIGLDAFPRPADGFLEAYSFNNVLLGRVTTRPLNLGQVETLEFVRPEPRIAYVLASGSGTKRVALDNLRVERTLGDCDADGLGDACEPDEDGDGIPDECDCVGDFNQDGQVNLTDLSRLLAHYGQPAGATAADGDTNDDGDVDLSDLSVLLSRFGTACP